MRIPIFLYHSISKIKQKTSVNKENFKKQMKLMIKLGYKSINLQVSKEELEKRSKEWKMPEANYKSGALSKNAFFVGSAANGATTDPRNFLNMSKYLKDNMLVYYD